METNTVRPVFRFEQEEGIEGRGELIAILGDTPVAASLSPSLARLMRVMLRAHDDDQDLPMPADLRGRRTYAQIAKEYARRLNHSQPPQTRAMGKFMRRIQRRFDDAWKAAVPQQAPPPLFDRRGARGAALAIEIPRKQRRYRNFGAQEDE